MRKRLLALLVLCSLSLILVTLGAPTAPVFADVGNQNDYSSSDDWGSSDSSSSWDDDDDYDYSYGSSSSSSGGSGRASTPGEILIDLLFAVGIIAFWVFFFRWLNKTSKKTRPSSWGIDSPPPTPMIPDQSVLEAQIKAGDPNFNAEQFKGWVKELFLMLNEAWTEREWGKIRRFETNALFNEHRMLLDKYKENGTVNIIDQIGIKEVNLIAFTKDEHFEYLTVQLHAQLIDYIINESSGQVVRGDPNKIYHMLYTLVFARTLGAQSLSSLENVGITKCPSCGASMEQTASNQCEYCRSIVTSGEYNWVLSSYTGKNM